MRTGCAAGTGNSAALLPIVTHEILVMVMRVWGVGCGVCVQWAEDKCIDGGGDRGSERRVVCGLHVL